MAENVAVLGPAGTFSEQAAERMYPGAELEYLDSVEAVFRRVDGGGGLGVVAMENSLEGSVGMTMESLLKYDLKITKETTLDIVLSLMAAPGVKPGDVKLVMSHPHALAQCRDYLAKNYPGARLQGSASTTEAMTEAAKRGDAAAVGLKEAGLRYGLAELAEGVQDQESQTRFIALSKKPGEGTKTSILFASKDEPGALYSILRVFADANVNLTKIESRPSRRKLGEYWFYVDYENRGMFYRDRELLHMRIRERSTMFKDLGSY